MRSSNYGISPFPAPCGWTKAIDTMKRLLPRLDGRRNLDRRPPVRQRCQLEFPRPNDGKNYGSRIRFSGSDKHERFLDYFDSRGIKVWLQVESGFADIPTLVDLVLKRYRHHPSVAGFGVDVEWFNPRGADLNDPVTDDLAERWDTKVRSYGPAYSLFLKHFDQSSMPPNYRGQIVFVDDSQYLGTVDNFVAEMKAWADRYHPNPVMYQIGYEGDREWWSKEAEADPEDARYQAGLGDPPGLRSRLGRLHPAERLADELLSGLGSGPAPGPRPRTGQRPAVGVSPAGTVRCQRSMTSTGLIPMPR